MPARLDARTLTRMDRCNVMPSSRGDRWYVRCRKLPLRRSKNKTFPCQRICAAKSFFTFVQASQASSRKRSHVSQRFKELCSMHECRLHIFSNVHITVELISSDCLCLLINPVVFLSAIRRICPCLQIAKCFRFALPNWCWRKKLSSLSRSELIERLQVPQ